MLHVTTAEYIRDYCVISNSTTVNLESQTFLVFLMEPFSSRYETLIISDRFASKAILCHGTMGQTLHRNTYSN